MVNFFLGEERKLFLYLNHPTIYLTENKHKFEAKNNKQAHFGSGFHKSTPTTAYNGLVVVGGARTEPNPRLQPSNST